MWRARLLLFVFPVVLTAGKMVAQQKYALADVEDGGRLYRGNCMLCHGPDGDAVTGVDLGHGNFTRASTDDDLVRIIRTGIQGTPMPPSNYSEFQARTVVAYLRSMAADVARSASPPGDALRGKSLFEGKGQCATCHRVKGAGSRMGPDLTQIGALRRGTELEQSILDPDAEVLAANQYLRVVMKDGTTIRGRLLNQDSFTLQLLDSNERLVLLSKASLRESVFDKKSPMPSYRGKLNSQELSDLVSYLASLKGEDKP